MFWSFFWFICSQFFRIFYSLCGSCCSVFYSECWASCWHSKRKSIINQPIVKKKNTIYQKNDLLSSDFYENSIPISPQKNNSSEENKWCYDSSIYNNYNPNNNICYNNYNESTPIDNIAKTIKDFDDNIERTWSNYDKAPLPYDLPNEKAILKNYQKNIHKNSN